MDLIFLQRLPLLQVFLRLFRLTLQRPQLLFQLRQDIVDAKKVLLLILQFFLCCLLPLFKFDDAGSLIKKLSCLLRLRAQDPVDLSLSDDGIAFFADTRIVKQLLHIFQPADCPV